MMLHGDRIENIAIMTLMFGDSDIITPDTLLLECRTQKLDVNFATVQSRLDHLVKCHVLKVSGNVYQIDAGDELEGDLHDY